MFFPKKKKSTYRPNFLLVSPIRATELLFFLALWLIAKWPQEGRILRWEIALLGWPLSNSRVWGGQRRESDCSKCPQRWKPVVGWFLISQESQFTRIPIQRSSSQRIKTKSLCWAHGLIQSVVHNKSNPVFWVSECGWEKQTSWLP